MIAGQTRELPTVGAAALDRLMPMHVLLDADGAIVHAGPTLMRLLGEDPVLGRPFLEVFELRRPGGIDSARALADAAGRVLTVRLCGGDGPFLTGLAQPAMPGGLIVNLSFGISVVDAVGRHALHAGDFAATDPTVELLYLVEAKDAVLDEFHKLNQRLQGARVAAEEQAFTDTLTGLKNRRALDHVLARYARAGLPHALLHLDLDWFKQVNDTHGHAAGDHVLQRTAEILVSEIREDDTAVRMGGDEFLLIFPRLTRRDRLAALAQRLLERLQEPMPFGDVLCRVSASIGIAVCEAGGTADAAGNLARADAALYLSKRRGRGRFSFSAPGCPPGCVPGAVHPQGVTKLSSR
ncbi:MAG: diguanylate cyclase domain-containing protein [Paracoccaceae bacterium]